MTYDCVTDEPSYRVTSLADALKLNFALITTDRRRANYDALSSKFHSTRHSPAGSVHEDFAPNPEAPHHNDTVDGETPAFLDGESIDANEMVSVGYAGSSIGPPSIELNEHPIQLSDLNITTDYTAPASITSTEYNYHLPPHPEDDFDDEYADDNAREVTYGRLVSGHIVDDDYPSVPASVKDEDEDTTPAPNHMMNSIYSITSSTDHALGGAVDANETDDDEEPGVASMTQEKMITLVGHVRDRTVLLIDDMIDRPGSWIAAAEHCVKRAGANKVYCIATHGVFGGECLEEMEACSYIDYVSAILCSISLKNSNQIGKSR